MLTLAVAHVFERGLVAQAVLAGLDDQRETRRNGLGGLGGLGLFGGSHCECRGWLKERRRRRRLSILFFSLFSHTHTRAQYRIHLIGNRFVR